MAQEIKRRIVLEGEKEYSAALKEAQRNLKTLRSELKAETAELGANATEQQKNETRARNLQKQIAEQEKIVKTLRAALAEAKEEYGDNEEVVAKWEQKLNDARATLAEMKNGLAEASQAVRETGSSFREATDGAAAAVVATKSAADAMGELGSVGEAVSGAIEGVFFGMIRVIEDAVSALWDMVSETAAKVNGWEDIAGYWGADTQTIQQYARAVAASGNAFEDLNSAVSKLVLGGKTDKITELLGISGVNYTNDWDYAIAALSQLYELRKSGQDMDPVFEEIFGERKSTKVMDLINDWETITGLLAAFNGDQGGFGLSSEALDTMAALHVQISTVEEKWEALKDNFTAGLGTATGSLLVNVEGSLDALNDFMNAETPAEREAALDDLRGNVEAFFTKAADILREGIAILGEVGSELQKSDDPVTALIGNILVGVTDALDWIVKNQEAVETAFYTIFAVCLLGHLASAGAKLAEVITQIQAIQAFNGLNATAQASLAGAAGAGAAGAAGAGAAGAASSAASAAATGLPGWLSALSVGALFKTAMEASEKTGMGLYGMMGRLDQFHSVPVTLPSAEELEAAREEQEKEKQRQEIQDQNNAMRHAHKRVVTGVASEDSMQTGASLTELTAMEQQRKLDNYIAGIQTSGIEGIENMAEEALAALAQRIADLGLGAGYAYGFATLDELYRELKVEERLREQENLLSDAPDIAGTEPTRSQQHAAEAYWDYLRTHEPPERNEVYRDALLSYFEEQDSLLVKLDEAISQMTEADNWREQENLPVHWWMDAASWRNAGGNESSLTSADLQGFRSLPASMASAVAAGAAKGVSGISVQLDGYTVGRLVAPYVSETVARDVIIG